MSQPPARAVAYRGATYAVSPSRGDHVWTIVEAPGGAVVAHVTRGPRGAFDVHPVRRGFSPLHAAAIFVASAPGTPAGVRVYATFVEFGGETFEAALRDDGAWEFARARDDHKLGEARPEGPGRLVAAGPVERAQLERLVRFVGLA
jgi:hypothetical protein